MSDCRLFYCFFCSFVKNSHQSGVLTAPVWLLHGWCHLKLLLSQHILCTSHNHAPVYSVTSCKTTYKGACVFSCKLLSALLAEWMGSFMCNCNVHSNTCTVHIQNIFWVHSCVQYMSGMSACLECLWRIQQCTNNTMSGMSGYTAAWNTVCVECLHLTSQLPLSERSKLA